MVADLVEVHHPPEAQRITSHRCNGPRKGGKEGELCDRVFFEAYLAPGSIVRKRCDRCKKVNFWRV